MRSWVFKDILRRMILARFFALPDFALWCHQGDQHGVLRVPQNVSEIDDGVDVLNEIERSHVSDLNENPDLLPAAGAWPPADLDRFRSYKAREVWRIGSYIVFACTLDGVIRRTYEHLVSMLQFFSEAAFRDLESRHRGARDARREGLRDVRRLRNKVFAHTSFADPRGDSRSMQATSLKHFAGSIPVFSDGQMLVGGSSVQIRGDNTASLPMVGVSDLASKMGTHVDAWHGMCLDAMHALLALTDDDFKAKWPVVEQVTRRPLVNATVSP